MDEPKGKEYAGPSGIGRDSFWLTAEDLLEGRDVDVKIEQVVLYPKITFQGGRTRTNMLGLHFEAKERVLGLNATNRKTMNKMFGNLTRAWKGQMITLYVTQTQMAGETVNCVRIRDRGSRAATAAEEFLADEKEPEANDAVPTNGELAERIKQGQQALGLSDKKLAQMRLEAGSDEALDAALNRMANGL